VHDTHHCAADQIKLTAYVQVDQFIVQQMQKPDNVLSIERHH
jgi:hypothetical protein